MIGERTRVAMQHLKRQGRRVGGMPYGWRLADDGKHLEQDPAQQVVVELARELRASGYTLQAICDALQAGGHTSRTGRPFVPSQVQRMLAA